MNDDLRFDPVDDELRRRFGEEARHTGEADAVLDDLRPRLRRARTRRRVALSSALATAAAAVVIVVAFAFGGGGGTGSVRTPPAGGGDRRPNPTVTTSVPQPTVTSLDDHGGDKGGNGSAADGGTTQSETSVPSAAAPPATDGGTPTSAPATVPTAHTQTYTSTGGSIVVNFDGSVVSLSSSSPAAGFTAAVHDNGPTRVEVRFTDGQTEWRIRVDVVNGALQPEITQH